MEKIEEKKVEVKHAVSNVGNGCIIPLLNSEVPSFQHLVKRSAFLAGNLHSVTSSE